MHQKGFSNILLIIIGIVLGFAAIGLYTSMNTASPTKTSSHTPTPVVSPTPEANPMPVAEACGIHVTAPVTNATVGSIITITGSLDGACHWTAFEATAGRVRVYDANNNPLSNSAVLVAGSDWMALPVAFSGQVMLTGIPSTRTGYMLFENDDPSGEFPETYVLPIRF